MLAASLVVIGACTVLLRRGVLADGWPVIGACAGIAVAAMLVGWFVDDVLARLRARKRP